MSKYRNYYKVYDSRTKELLAEGNAKQAFRTSVLRINHGIYHNYIIETTKIDE